MDNYKPQVHYRISKEWLLNTTSHGCPEGRALTDWYEAQTCKDSEVTELDEPIVYDLHKDPFELYPLLSNNTMLSDILVQFEKVVERHEETIDEDEIVWQLGHFNATVIPCCNYPKCKCE